MGEAQEVKVHVVGLQSPGKVFERKLAIDSAAKVFRQRPARVAPRGSLYSRHNVHKRAPLPHRERKSRPEKRAVLFNTLACDARAIVAASIQYQAHVREAVKGQHFPEAFQP